MRGRGIRDGEEREWSWGGITCSYNFDSLFSALCFHRAERRDGAYDERVRDKSDRVRERSSVRAEEEKNEESTTKKKKKRGKRSNWADVNCKCGRGYAFPTSICLVIVYRYNGWNEPSGLASSTLESVRWHFKTTLKLWTGFARARETKKRSGRSHRKGESERRSSRWKFIGK